MALDEIYAAAEMAMQASQRQVESLPAAPQKLADQVMDKKWEVLPFRNPLDMLLYFDPDVQSGAVKLYPWQVARLIQVGGAYTAEDPLFMNVCAANGSGKDKYFIAPTAIWTAIAKVRSRTIATSSSAQQLDTQTEYWIRRLADIINNAVGDEWLRVVKRHITCPKSGSEILTFATDEGGKAEGYHPDYGCEQTIIINEAKSVLPIIFEALSRCTGYNRWLEVSSPGIAAGPFYEACMSRKNFFRVTAFDCPHITRATIEEAKRRYGESSALYRSMILAEFSSANEEVVVKRENVDKVVKKFSAFRKAVLGQGQVSRDIFEKLVKEFWIGRQWPRRGGLDLAAGGDENVFSVFQGNVQLGQECFRCEDTETSADMLERLFTKWGFSKADAEYIHADDGGVGKGIIDKLWRRGWMIRRVLFGGAALNKREFSNAGAERWFSVARLFEEGIISIVDDEKLKQQISTRYYIRSDASAKMRLESKKDARAAGRPSPDRADALVLAHWDLCIDDYLLTPEKLNSERPPQLSFAEQFEQARFGQIPQGGDGDGLLRRIYGNITKALDLTGR